MCSTATCCSPCLQDIGIYVQPASMLRLATAILYKGTKDLMPAVMHRIVATGTSPFVSRDEQAAPAILCICI